MKKFNLVDTLFSHEKSIVAGKIPTYFEWNNLLQGNDRVDGPVFYSHEQMLNSITTSYDNSFGLLFESQLIIPGIYHKIRTVENKFKYIFTYNRFLIDKDPNKFKFIPAQGIWIGGHKGGGSIDIKSKIKNISMIASEKTMTPMQSFRCKVAKMMKEKDIVTVFGKSVDNPIVGVSEALDQYRFSIVIENAAIDNYFTEKLLNCFAVGTIPIYLGCRNINKFFNMDGIISLNDILPKMSYENLDNELLEYIKTLDENSYEVRKDAIQDNFKRCLQYEITEDYMYLKYLQ